MNSMHSPKREPEQGERGTHIWLRYAIQFSQGDRSYTVEMGIPVPLGASAEQREQLLREAEAGMSQLSQSVERRVAQMLHAPVSSASQAGARPVAMPPTRPVTKTSPVPAATAPQNPAPSLMPAAAAAPLTGNVANAATGNRASAEAKEATRPTVGLSMPRMPGTGGDMQMPEFIANLREHLGLNPKEAMTMLKVKSLSGINLRDAFEQLEAMLAQTPAHADTAHTTSAAASIAERDTSAMAKVVSPAPTAPTAQAVPPQPLVIEMPTHIAGEREGEQGDEYRDGHGDEHTQNARSSVRERAPLSRFDEEEADEDREDAPALDDDLEDLPLLRELSADERARSRTLVSKMREMRGATLANTARLQVLRTLVDQQLSPDDLRDLVKGVWGVLVLKKLKVDQTEFLISWAKEDDFVEEAQMVLLLLEEEGTTSFPRPERS